MKADRETFPVRLAEGTDASAELLRKVEKQPPHAPPEAAAWERTLTRLGQDTGHPRLRLAAAAVAGALAGAVALFVALSPRAPVTDDRPGANDLAATVHSESATGAGPANKPPLVAAVATAPLPVPPSSVTELVRAETPRIQLGRAPVGLPGGPAELVGEATVALSRGGSARAFTTAAAATVELAAGEVELHVEKRPAAAEHAFEVTAGPYRFTVLGTVFRVSRGDKDVTLSVSEGRVAVSRLTAPRTDAPLTIVTGGGFWSGASALALLRSPAARAAAGSPMRTVDVPLAAARPSLLALTGASTPVVPSAAKTPSVPAVEPAPFASAAPVKAISVVPPPTRPSLAVARPPAPRAQALAGSCASRTNTAPRAALDCFLNEARGSDLGAQVALYEAARLYRDALGDAAHAITTLRELRRRFPGGALAVEADLSLAELLPKLGKYREALDASAAALASHPARERADELHLLRGDLLRAGLGDCAGAATEYAAADNASRDSVADPASFGRALCLEALGRGAEAREAFDRYLARPHARHASEATRHVRELAGVAR